MNRCASLKLIAITLLSSSGFAFSADPPVPTTSFNLIGYIQQFRMCQATDTIKTQTGGDVSWCNSPGDPRSGAIMKVNGINVVIPNNSYVVMPGSYLKPQDIFDRKLPGTPAGQSGLALEDTPPPPFPYVADLIGNIVDGEYIAGLANIMQVPLQTGSGFIKAISDTGELQIGPELRNSKVTAKVRLNDPSIDPNADPKINPDPGTGSGRYGKAQSPDTRFKSDQGNPTVHAATGYPMCVPTKPANTECLETNRPPVDLNGNGLRRFTMGSTEAVSDAPASSCKTACNPNKMVPLAKGDYVVYTGILVKEPTAADPNATYVSASSLEANLGIYTEKGKDPAYVFIEVGILGTGGTAFPGLDIETGPGKVLPGQTLVTRFRIVGFTTDPSRNVDVYALDSVLPAGNPDPNKQCTDSRGTVSPIPNVSNNGKYCERLLTSVQPEQIAPIGRFRITVDQQVFMPPTREIRARINSIVGSDTIPRGSATKTAANGLIYGEYTAPVAEYIFPEGRVFGAKKPLPGLIPANFEDLCFLSRGWWPADEAAVLEPLDPWPSSGHDRLSGVFCN